LSGPAAGALALPVSLALGLAVSEDDVDADALELSLLLEVALATGVELAAVFGVFLLLQAVPNKARTAMGAISTFRLWKLCTIDPPFPAALRETPDTRGGPR
jgi:hypothetical protein